MTTLNMTTKLMSSIVFTAAVVLTLYVRQSLSLPVVDAIQPYDYLKIYNDQKRNQRRRAFPKRRHDHHRHHNKKTGTRRVETPVTANDDDDVQELYITQKLDHFDPLSTATYQQRYFVSYRYNSADDGRLRLDAGNGKNVTSRSTSLKGATVINFLCVGGEGPGFDKSVLVDSVHCSGDMLELASKIQTLTKITDDSTTGSSRVSINLYALEHRYYGKSYPSFDDTDGSNQTSPVTTNHLKYLSSRQALEDLAHFIRTINSETRMSGRTGSENDDGDEGDVLWVTFGGSYPGYMSLNARYKYPHLVHASVSSSAPLQLEVDFPGYKARQGWDLKYKKVGGSEECYRIVKTGHDQAVTLLTMPGRNTTTNQTGAEMLARKFDICNPESALSEARNAQLLLGDGLINIPAQSNDPSCGDDALCNIAGLCEYMEKEFEKSSKESSRDRQQRYVHDNIEDPAKMSELDVLAKVAKHQRSSERRRFFMYSQETDENVIDDDDDCMEVDFQAMIAEWNKTSVEPFGWRYVYSFAQQYHVWGVTVVSLYYTGSLARKLIST